MAHQKPSPKLGTVPERRSAYQRTKLQLPPADKKALAAIMRSGKQSARVFKRVRILQMLDLGKTLKQTAEGVGTGERTVRDVRQRYLEEGLERILHEAPRRIPDRAIDPKQAHRLVAMLCGPSPEGRARWSIRLARDEAIARGIVPKVGRETIRVLMSSHELKPWREKNVVHCGIDAGLHCEDGGAS
jgi:transposase